MKDEKVSFDLPKDEKELLIKLAKTEDLNTSQYIRKILRKHIFGEELIITKK